VLTISYSTPLSVDETDGTLGFHSMDCNLRIEVLAAVSLMVQISNVMLCHWTSSSDVSLSLCSCCLTLKMRKQHASKHWELFARRHTHISEDLNLQVTQWLELHHEGKLVLQMASFSDTCVVCYRCDWLCLNVRRQSSFICIQSVPGGMWNTSGECFLC